ncbi:hypothetical protein OG711_38170 [Streptomyces uncialis]|uniref:globin domain-containing protein n=1 Tax=Streptomyces uncialis TaxID=1048205 RepID=UPI002E30A649|nr:hypothetical protein [Streptomyces uncialis]
MVRKHVVTSGGRVLLLEEMTKDQARDIAREFYREVGGANFFQRLCSAFYQLATADPVLAPMFPGKAEDHARRLADHFNRMYGTPDLSEGWDQRFLASHLHVVIGNQHRRRWLTLMRAAGEEINAPDPWFSDFMTTMTNGSGAITAASRGAAIARGLDLDREGTVIGQRRTSAAPATSDEENLQ